MGLHSAAVKKTDSPLIADGKSDYKIIVPKKAAEGAGERYRFAANDLQNMLMYCTGVVLEVIAAGDLMYGEDAKYLSVGENGFSDSAGISFDKTALGSNGARILTKGKSVFIGGGGIYGTTNAVYEFLRLVTGFKIYAQDEIVFDKSARKKVMFCEMDVTEIPDFQWRQKGQGMLSDTAYIRRMRLSTTNDVFIHVAGLPFHNTFGYIPPSLHRAAHPKWFALGTEHQLCFLARGDAAEKKKFDDQFFGVLKASVIANTEVDNISVTQEDARIWCQCDACKAEYEKYGTDSATVIKFCNQMSRRLAAWIQSDENTFFPRSRIVNIVFFAYQKTVDAPVKTGADGYEPMDESVVCDQNVFPYYAPIETHYNKPFDDDGNKNNRENLKKWGTVSKKMFLWPYSANYAHYMFPYNSYGTLQHNYRLFKSCRPELIFDLHQHNQDAATAFQEFKWWLAVQLMWDTERDTAALTDEYFRAYFKDAAAPMREFFEGIRAHMAYLEQEKGVTGHLYFKIDEPDYWPIEKLKAWLRCIDEAYAAVKSVKAADSLLYKKLCKRIALESIFPRFALIDLHAKSLPAGRLRRMKEAWREDVLSLHVNRVSEWVMIDTVFTKWGL
ncbi:MAG: DUF4838 domain-containing protein [Clostridiales bacterium]|nr:DUF4838 domain-containing protein [Clostridiales bacterium]